MAFIAGGCGICIGKSPPTLSNLESTDCFGRCFICARVPLDQPEGSDHYQIYFTHIEINEANESLRGKDAMWRVGIGQECNGHRFYDFGEIKEMRIA